MNHPLRLRSEIDGYDISISRCRVPCAELETMVDIQTDSCVYGVRVR